MALLLTFLIYNSYKAFSAHSNFIIYMTCLLLVFTFLILAGIEKLTLTHKLNKTISEICTMLDTSSDKKKPLEPNRVLEKEFVPLFSSIESYRVHYERRITTYKIVLDLKESLPTDLNTDALVDAILPKLINETNSGWGVFYIYNPSTEKLQLKKSLGLSKNIYKEFDVAIGEGFIGFAAQQDKIHITNDIPSDTIFKNKTFLGKIVPKSILTMPIHRGGELLAVAAFGSIYEYTDSQIQILDLFNATLGIALYNCSSFAKIDHLTKELRFQNELIQNMNDELEEKVKERTSFLYGILNYIEDYYIISVDANGYILAWNNIMEKTTGLSFDSIYAKPLVETLPYGVTKEKFNKKLILAKENNGHTEIDYHIRDDGSQILVNTTIMPIFDRNSELYAYKIICKDISRLSILKLLNEYNKHIVFKVKNNNYKNRLLIWRNFTILDYDNDIGNLFSASNLIGTPLTNYFVNAQKLKEDIDNVITTGLTFSDVYEVLNPNDNCDYVTLQFVLLKDNESSVNVGVVVTVIS